MERMTLLVAWVFIFSTASARFIKDDPSESLNSQDSIKDVKNESSDSQGTCFYNSTWFPDKAELPTRGLCLICHCFPGFSEPNAFTCSVIDCPWEDYHKRFPGCTPIYADRDCCPIGWECDYGTTNPGQQQSKSPDCDCEWRYLKHYEAKGCRPVYEEKPWGDKPSCQCPWRFDCSLADEIQPDDKACIYKKHVYPIGSKIPTTNPCETCTCSRDYFTQAASISCNTMECPSVYSQTPLPEGCHYVYKEKQCCPTSVECPTAQKDNIYQVPMCEYKEKMYYEGEQIYPDEDPCMICLCSQNWTGINSTSCRQHDCMLERDSRKLKQGCIPIYHEKTCCPIDYHCADDDLSFDSNKGASFKSDDDEDEMCFFENRYYQIGHVLDIKHPTNCVTCTCKTPPDFTCIHSSCPPPPNNDYTNCRAVYKPQSCCPDYTCAEKKVEFEDKKGDDVREPEVDSSLQALIEQCKKMECATGERCMLVERKCENETCLPDPKCEKVAFGCGQATCPEGCEKIGTYENDCPICCCKKPTQEEQYRLSCRVQSCEENCVLTGRDDNNCPLCKCPQGNLEERTCALSPCTGYNCTLEVNSLGCAECSCQLACKPRECPAGCDLDLEASSEGVLECGCHCHNSSSAMDHIYSKPLPETCPKISCQGLNCSIGEDKSGCPTCSCVAPCPTPECQDGCAIEKEVAEPGRCPGCVCKLSRAARDNAAKECPALTCLGYNCSVLATEDGCQECVCESPCEDTPSCPPHCTLEPTAPEGRCKGCICSSPENDSEVANASDDKSQQPLRGGGKVPEDEDLPERREDTEADYIPLPGADLVPGVEKIYLIHGDDDQEHAGLPGYHYNGGHAYPVFGEPLESVLYSSDLEDKETYAEVGTTEKARLEDLDEEASEDRNMVADYEDYGEHAEEKTMDDEDEKCAKKDCPEGQKCVIRRLQCIRNPCPTIPVCIDVEPRCPIPMCAIGCMVMKWDDEVCPSCFCGIIRGAEGRVCPRTACMGRRCYNVIGDDGCPACKCDSICIPPTCSDGCWINSDPPEGKCPTCVCTQRSTIVPQIFSASPTAEEYGMKKFATRPPVASYHCPTPHCNGYNCSLIRGSDGCQKCVCDSPCAPCPQHCVKTKTLSEGRCPICDCTVSPQLSHTEERQCPVVDCQRPNCRTVQDSDGCPSCVCDPKCATPNCDPGCEILTNVPPGQCPGCVCKVTVIQAGSKRKRPVCPSVTCTGPNCKEVLGQDGCKKCLCQPLCPAPKCDPGCEIQTDVAQGQCPTCVCSGYMDGEDEEDEMYCPNLFCSDYGCREIPGPTGCPICLCDPICKTPTCDPGCQVVTNRYHGRCPVCICSSPSEPPLSANLSSPIKGIQQQMMFTDAQEPITQQEVTPFSFLQTTVTVELETTPTPTTTEVPTTTTCPPPVCQGLRCNVEMGTDGCEVCKCKYKCPTPKCVGNCYAETNAPAHRCPGCVCPSRRRPGY